MPTSQGGLRTLTSLEYVIADMFESLRQKFQSYLRQYIKIAEFADRGHTFGSRRPVGLFLGVLAVTAATWHPNLH